MKYAIVDARLREALPGLLGTCPICDVPVTPKCGRFRAAHWAHPPGSVDHRWEPETEWHRNWKGYFPIECHEIVHTASNGERHIADVKTEHGLVLELQNSPISEEERRSREGFYRPMCWVVNGQRLKWDRRQFFGSLRRGRVKSTNPLSLAVPMEKCALLQKWADGCARVFFDFGETEDAGDVFHFGAPVLWASDPRGPKGKAILTPVYRRIFLDAVTKGEPIRGINFSKVFERARRLLARRAIPSQSRRWKSESPSYGRYSGRNRRAWSRSSIAIRRKRVRRDL